MNKKLIYASTYHVVGVIGKAMNKVIVNISIKCRDCKNGQILFIVIIHFIVIFIVLAVPRRYFCCGSPCFIFVVDILCFLVFIYWVTCKFR